MLKDLALLGVGAIFGLGATLMSLAAPLYFPNAPRWIWRWLFWGGIVLMLLMIADALVLLKWNGTLRSSLWLIIVLNAAFLMLSATAIWLYGRFDRLKEVISKVTLTISKIRPDENGPTEIYAHFYLNNLGEPTTIKNWMLSATTPNGTSFSAPPRTIYTKHTFQTNKPPIYEDLMVDPLEKGGSRPDSYVTYSHPGPVEVFMEPGTVFCLSAQDIWGGKISSKYTIP